MTILISGTTTEMAIAISDSNSCVKLSVDASCVQSWALRASHLRFQPIPLASHVRKGSHKDELFYLFILKHPQMELQEGRLDLIQTPKR
ncbi:hypothetical protein DPMN_027130 [Dreissena polymorpha]|uniref:Uncharacterized protein n=1 Tax=Dreissena polymorpha TaxID=45954 RepID=A0A9D4LWF9_DREPO|nr:hypothetical protein DPMN_027130 [Dreissena polymorpha]